MAPRAKSDGAVNWPCEEDVLATTRRSTRLLTTLAHELRNPLAAIQLSVQQLRQQLSDDGLAQPMWSLLERQLDHLSGLVHGVLDVARLDQGKLHLHKAPTVLQDVIQQAMTVAMPLAERAGLTVTISLPHAPIVLEADPLRLTQVVANLVDNACKFTPAGGRIEIYAESAEGVARVTVADTGVGIPAEELPYVFDGFWSRPEHRDTEGIGVGLTLVASIVKLHGGVVEVISDGPGRGSTFVVTLPLASTGAVDNSTPPHSLQSAPPHRVLVVDDNADLVDLLAEALTQMGMEVATATDGRRILDLMHAFRPTVALLAITMAPLDGYQVAKRIRQHSDYQDVALVALSDRNLGDDGGCPGVSEFAYHLVKPVSMEQLQRTLASVPIPAM
ncbi:MAG: hybrid sensor histidine kinase/response regulator [Clostridia bacterium]